MGLAVNPFPVMGEIAATIRVPNRDLYELGPPALRPAPFPGLMADTPGTPTMPGVFFLESDITLDCYDVLAIMLTWERTGP